MSETTLLHGQMIALSYELSYNCQLFTLQIQKYIYINEETEFQNM